jgi:hypothetical protein
VKEEAAYTENESSFSLISALSTIDAHGLGAPTCTFWKSRLGSEIALKDWTFYSLCAMQIIATKVVCSFTCCLLVSLVLHETD